MIGQFCGTLENFAQRIDFFVRDWFSSRRRSDEAQDSLRLENREAIFPTQSCKAISRKERNLHLFFSVRPVIEALGCREKVLDISFRQLVTNEFFMAGKSPHRKPGGTVGVIARRDHNHSFALSVPSGLPKFS